MGAPPSDNFSSLTREPQVQYAREGVNPPSPLYIGRNDLLRLTVWNSIVNLQASVDTRLLLPDGRIVPGRHTLIPTSARAQSDLDINLSEGFLLSAAVLATLGNPRRGQTFVRLLLLRGSPVGQAFPEILVADYLDTRFVVGWPGGPQASAVDGAGTMRSIAGADPAAGAEISETVPTNARWRLWGFTFTLVTDATAANRVVDVALDDGAAIYYRASVPTAQTASQTVIYSAAPQGVAQGVTNLRALVPLPTPCPLFQGHRIRTVTQALQAGDNFGAPQYLVEELIEE